MKLYITLIAVVLLGCGGGNDPSMPQPAAPQAAAPVSESPTVPAPAPSVAVAVAKEHEPVTRETYLSRATEKPHGK